jgi:hypothetical protein
LEYSGGAYNLQNARFSGVTRVVLMGAAANTVAILPVLEAIVAGQKPKPANPNTPIIKTAAATTPQLVSLVSPYQ